MNFPEQWKVRAPRPTTVDPSTGNRRPGPAPAAVTVWATLEERFPRTDEKQLPGPVVAAEAFLLLHPSAEKKVAGGITLHHQVISPEGEVWSIVRLPRPRKRRRLLAPTRYIALVVRRATDIKEN
ncbi:hypothetical protein [Gordonia sp. (in: high G+C Gram-positive bacteria)]|uniref:hypothetical protein n=1 Tax=Gordonia sp. (in: high G+C Gram-positive bacteria) TaxID=84139 RepID=UPI003C76F940